MALNILDMLLRQNDECN